jgi:hypothetical protein
LRILRKLNVGAPFAQIGEQLSTRNPRNYPHVGPALAAATDLDQADIYEALQVAGDGGDGNTARPGQGLLAHESLRADIREALQDSIGLALAIGQLGEAAQDGVADLGEARGLLEVLVLNQGLSVERLFLAVGRRQVLYRDQPLSITACRRVRRGAAVFLRPPFLPVSIGSSF